ncbi:hypothetical protein BDD43_3731 [Mucilaginibacter gracilis]|uniref:Uncharacterized protein n=1 Tax=Mucilaginibacter gracilis TaxID=423350 RepID=A0A495J4A2_9SPHI|nr:hypothetical protein [Mucilaginibacter gracilis]RKR83521.1 hypothetical protein BDD43_3731 [Mucilaginibacter gracilis]
MKTLDAATIRDMAEAIAYKTMLAAIATLCSRFILKYMAVGLCYYHNIRPFLYRAYAQKRIANKNIHDRKFALFTGCTEQGDTQSIEMKKTSLKQTGLSLGQP